MTIFWTKDNPEVGLAIRKRGKVMSDLVCEVGPGALATLKRKVERTYSPMEWKTFGLCYHFEIVEQGRERFAYSPMGNITELPYTKIRQTYTSHRGGRPEVKALTLVEVEPYVSTGPFTSEPLF